MERDDLADADAVLGVVRSLGAWQLRYNRPANLRPLREVIWFYWTAPRIASNGRYAKYPGADLWTPAALESVKHQGFAGLVLEHREPLNILMKEFVALPPPSAADLTRVLTYRIYTVVVTKAEDQRLSANGLRERMPKDWKPGDDPWARYRAIGLQPTQFERPPALVVPLTPDG